MGILDEYNLFWQKMHKLTESFYDQCRVQSFLEKWSGAIKSLIFWYFRSLNIDIFYYFYIEWWRVNFEKTLKLLHFQLPLYFWIVKCEIANGILLRHDFLIYHTWNNPNMWSFGLKESGHFTNKLLWFFVCFHCTVSKNLLSSQDISITKNNIS